MQRSLLCFQVFDELLDALQGLRIGYPQTNASVALDLIV
jgi:hypothetical protein